MTGQDYIQPTLFPEGFHVSLIALQASIWRLMMSAIYGANYSECIGKLAQNGSWLKMYSGCYQVKMDGFLDEYLETWPKLGVMCGGYVFQPMQSELHFGVKESRLWPRPLASDGRAWVRNKKKDPRSSI